MLDLEKFSDQAQAYFDSYVAQGSDDELFASGYLRGHVDLVIGSALVAGNAFDYDQLVERITESINTAIKNGELEQADVDSVNRVFNHLLEQLGSVDL